MLGGGAGAIIPFSQFHPRFSRSEKGCGRTPPRRREGEPAFSINVLRFLALRENGDAALPLPPVLPSFFQDILPAVVQSIEQLSPSVKGFSLHVDVNDMYDHVFHAGQW